MVTKPMDIFGERIDYTEYKEDIAESENLQGVKGCHFSLSDDLEILDRKGVMPRIKKAKRTYPKPEFYDLPMLEGLPIKNDNVNVYHDMRNQCLATNVINNITSYLKFGACVVKFSNTPKWINYSAFLDAMVDILRKTGRNSTILSVQGEQDCVLVQSKSYVTSIKNSIVDYVRNFIFRSKESSDYVNVTVNLEQVMDFLNQADFKEVAQRCTERHVETDRLSMKLESLKKDILSFTSLKDAVGVEKTLLDAIVIYAYLFYNDDLEGISLVEGIAYLDSKLGPSLVCTTAYKTGKVIIYALVYIEKMLDSVENFQIWGTK